MGALFKVSMCELPVEVTSRPCCYWLVYRWMHALYGRAHTQARMNHATTYPGPGGQASYSYKSMIIRYNKEHHCSMAIDVVG
jgi:hypothetical protein